MEIGSMSGMSGSSLGGMNGMQGMRRPPKGNSSEHAAEMSARIMKQQDADEDGSLSANELSTSSSSDSDLIAKLDTNGDGILSQEELLGGIQTNMESMKSQFESGNTPSTENQAFMQQMRDLAGPPSGAQQKASQAYGQMQEATVSSNSYNTDQVLFESLSVTV